MTKKHYEFMAAFIKAHIPYGRARDEAIDQFIDFAEKGNSRFDSERFARTAMHTDYEGR